MVILIKLYFKRNQWILQGFFFFTFGAVVATQRVGIFIFSGLSPFSPDFSLKISYLCCRVGIG